MNIRMNSGRAQLKDPFPRRSFLVPLRNLLQRIPFKPLDVNCVYFLEYTGIPRRDAAFSRGGCDVRSATLDDLPGITECQKTPETFLRRFQVHDHCVVAVVDGRIVGYEWFCDKPAHIEERYSYEIKIPGDAIYAYDAYILPGHRLSGIWLKFKIIYLRDLMESLHKTKIIVMIDRGNRMSMSTHLRFGFKVVREVFVLKLFGRTFSWEKKTAHQESSSPGPEPLTRTPKQSDAGESWFSKSVAS